MDSKQEYVEVKLGWMIVAKLCWTKQSKATEMAAEERSHFACSCINDLLPIQVSAAHIVFLAAGQLLFLYEVV